MNVYLNDGDKQADYTIHVSTHTADRICPEGKDSAYGLGTVDVACLLVGHSEVSGCQTGPKVSAVDYPK